MNMNKNKNKNVLIAIFYLLLVVPSVTLGQGNRPVVAVGEITTAVGQFNTMSIQIALENALQKTNKFTIMERTRLASLLEERGLSVSGITDGINDYSGFSGVDYLIYGSVSNITVENQSVLIASNCKASLSMNIRVVDIATGEIRLSESVEVEDTVNTVLDANQNACSGINLSSINVLGEDVSDGIANKLTMGIFPIQVARVNGSEVYLNYGEGTLAPEQILLIKTLGEGFLDPGTGEMLGQEEQTNAVIIATEVRSAFTIGEIVVSAAEISVGDIAYMIGSRDETRSVNSCIRATKRAVEACDRDPDGRRCVSRTEDKDENCSALLDL